MKPRIIVNLAFFAAIAIGLGAWAVGDVLRLDVSNPTYQLTADFEDSPGLQSGYDVGYLGTPIGRIRSVELAEGHVEVTMAIDDGQEIPRGSTLAVRRKSAIGEPYVDITPPAGAQVEGPVMEEGDHVPVERTETPLSYSELFAALNDLVATVPEDDLATLFHEFATAVDGRSGSLRDMITGSQDALETFAENADLIESSTANLANLAQVFADHRSSFDQALTNTETVTGTLASARADIERVLTDGGDLATRTADLIAGSEAELSCTIGGLSAVTIGLDRPEVVASLVEILGTAPAAARVFKEVIAWEDDGPYVRGIPPLNVGAGPALPVYDEPRELPELTPNPGCPEMTPAAAPGDASTAGPGGAGEVDGDASAAGDPGPDPAVDGEEASSDMDTDNGKFKPGPILLALLAIIAIAAIRPWRWRPGGH